MLANMTLICNRNLSSLTLKLVDGDEYILLGICLTVNPDPLVDELHINFHSFDCSHDYHFSQDLLHVHRKWSKFYISVTILFFMEPDISQPDSICFICWGWKSSGIWHHVIERTVHDVLLDLRRWMHHDLWNVRNHSLTNTVSHCRKPESSTITLLEPHILLFKCSFLRTGVPNIFWFLNW